MKTTNTSDESQKKQSVFVKYEILLFFSLSIAITWLTYLFISFFEIENQTVLSRWYLLAAFGPTISALIITRINNNGINNSISLSSKVLLFLLTFSVVFGIELIDHFCWNHKITFSLIIVDVLIVSFCAFTISNIFSRYDAVRSLVRKIFKFRISIIIILIATVLWPLLIYSSTRIALLTGMPVSGKPVWPDYPLLFIVVESFIWYLFLGGPLNEELGWRGFALNKLQKKYNPLYASIIIGILWGLWHLPLHLMGVYPFGVQGFLIRLFDIPSAIVFTWLYNRSSNSLIPVLFLHSARNTTSLFMSRSYIVSSLFLLVLSVVLVLTDKMWKKTTSKVEP